MFSYIKGELAETAMDHIVIDVNGVGFLIYIPTLILEELPAIGEMVKVHTYVQVREDAFVLYGFLDKDDLEMFKMLIGVSGIGPKGGLAILSTIPSGDLRFAILSGDAKMISKAPGIGSKTAQRVIIDLKDKVDFEDALEKKLEQGAGSGSDPKTENLSGRIEKDAIEALAALGYSAAESLKAVRKVEKSEGMDVEELLKAALKQMSFLG